MIFEFFDIFGPNTDSPASTRSRSSWNVVATGKNFLIPKNDLKYQNDLKYFPTEQFAFARSGQLGFNRFRILTRTHRF